MSNPKIDLKYFGYSPYKKIKDIIGFSEKFMALGSCLPPDDFENILGILGEQINCCGKVRDSLKKGKLNVSENVN